MQIMQKVCKYVILNTLNATYEINKCIYFAFYLILHLGYITCKIHIKTVHNIFLLVVISKQAVINAN